MGCKPSQEIERRQEWMDTPRSVIIIGNPGVGKSTTVNCLVGQKLFASRVTCNGQGITKELDKRTHRKVTFMDTPGLADYHLRKQAAEAIAQALREGGRFQVIFMLNGSVAGRHQPDDLTTMKLVLDACDDLKDDKFAILVNQCSTQFLKKLEWQKPAQTGQPAVPSWKTMLDEEMTRRKAAVTKHFFFAKSIHKLHEQDDVIASLPSDLWKFFIDVPEIIIKSQAVRDIDYQTYDELKEAFQTVQKKANIAVQDVQVALNAKQRAENQLKVRQITKSIKDEMAREGLPIQQNTMLNFQDRLQKIEELKLSLIKKWGDECEQYKDIVEKERDVFNLEFNAQVQDLCAPFHSALDAQREKVRIITQSIVDEMTFSGRQIAEQPPFFLPSEARLAHIQALKLQMVDKWTSECQQCIQDSLVQEIVAEERAAFESEINKQVQVLCHSVQSQAVFELAKPKPPERTLRGRGGDKGANAKSRAKA